MLPPEKTKFSASETAGYTVVVEAFGEKCKGLNKCQISISEYLTI
jgi:hypothetical protein